MSIMKNMINTIGYFGRRRIEWISESEIKPVKEFGCNGNRNNYNSYQKSDEPQFRGEKVNWF